MYYSILLAVSAFWLGACPFSLWIGRWFLGREIRDYGDGNPGAANVFRAGGRKTGVLAVALDVAKGVPFVYLAHAYFHLPDLAVVAVALGAILGHVFSPFLGWRGGKAVAVTYGALLALPQHELLISMALFMALGFLLIESHAWTIIFGATASLAYLAVTRGSSWEPLIMLFVLAVFVFRHFEELRAVPHARGRLVRWLHTLLRGTQLMI